MSVGSPLIRHVAYGVNLVKDPFVACGVGVPVPDGIVFDGATMIPVDLCDELTCSISFVRSVRCHGDLVL